jgi:flagellar basal-body rod protein FlgF
VTAASPWTKLGELVTLRGYAVLDAGGAPIQLNRKPAKSRSAPTASSSRTARQVAASDSTTADFANGFSRHDNSAVITVDSAPQPVVDRFDVGVMQGYVEESNVNRFSEMSQLIMVSRAFENITALMRDSETSVDEAIKTLGGSNAKSLIPTGLERRPPFFRHWGQTAGSGDAER